MTGAFSEKYVKLTCEECHGQGEIMVAKLYPNGHTECWDDCDSCCGDGFIEILESDYIIAKLKGEM